jgi:hypothetical protein
VIGRIALHAEQVPLFIQPQAVYGKADAGETLTRYQLKGRGRLVVDQINIPVVVADETENISKINLVIGNEPEFEGQRKILRKAE